MKSMFSILNHDLRRLFKNVFSGIVLVGLIAMPSLFSWFNILATWEPFENTDRLQVAVANTDEGHSSDLTPLQVNVGDMIVAQLYENEEMDWVFTSSEEAIEGTQSGDYYAAIVLPETLSRDMFTFYVSDAQPSEIDLYINEKKNPLSPLLISSGTQGVSTQINDTFLRTLSEVSLGLIDSASAFFTEEETQAALDTIESRIASIEQNLRSGSTTAESLSALTGAAIPLAQSAERISGSVGDLFPDIDSTDLGSTAGLLSGTFAATAESFGEVSDQASEVLNNVNTTTDTAASTIEDLASRVRLQTDQYRVIRDEIAGLGIPTGGVDDALAQLGAIATRFDNTAASLRSGQGDSSGASENMGAALEALERAQQSFETTIRPQLQEVATGVGDVVTQLRSVRSELSDVSAALDSSPGSLQETLSNASQTLANMSTSLAENADSLADAQTRIADARASGNLSSLQELVGDNPEELADALVAPISLERIEVFPIESFGVGMTPLYLALALWVGAVLTAVALRTDEESVEQNVVADDELPGWKKYLGRYLTFAVIGLAQSTLAVAGLIVYVQINPEHPGLMFVAGWITSLVFHLICYTLVISLSNAGKAISVLLLVLQISAAGGAYPLALLPGWVQAINPWLPATYAIDAFRAAIAGTYDGDFWQALGILSLFAIPILILGIWLRQPIYNLVIGKMEEAMAKTKVLQDA